MELPSPEIRETADRGSSMVGIRSLKYAEFNRFLSFNNNYNTVIYITVSL